MSKRRWPAGAWQRAGWRVFQVLAVAAFGYAAWRLLAQTPYRIDIDVYRSGGRAWLDGRPLYTGERFATQAGVDLPFTYPPLSAILFAPFAMLSLPAASAAITALTLVLLVVSAMIVLTRLDVLGAGTGDPAWSRRLFLALAIVGPAVIYLEPIRSNFDFGQINVVLMTLVLADAVPRRTPWPRGVLLGIAIALKLTPAVFLVYFVLRRDVRAVLTALLSFVAATLVGVALAWRDSLEYWTTTIRDPDRIGAATLNTNQNIAGMLARLGLSDGAHFALWTAACFAMLGLTVWAGLRVLRAGEPVLALICVALFGLAVSPVSWSHHWVWTLPTLVVGAVLAYRRRNIALGLVTAAGLALMIWTPIDLMPEHHEAEAELWRQLAGASYLWWAIAFVAVAGWTVTRPAVSPRPPAEPGPTAGPQLDPKPALHPL